MKLSLLPRMSRFLGEVVSAVQKSGSGEDINYNRHRQTSGLFSDTSVGTMSSSAESDPLNPGRSQTPGKPYGWDDPVIGEAFAFSTAKPAYDQTEHANVQNKGWPSNRSRAIANAGGERSEVLPTDRELQVGPMPGRIARYMPERVFGIVTPGTGTPGSEAAIGGADENRSFLAHVPVARQPHQTKGPQKLSDDNAIVPAVYAGNPRP